jgi:hypothetical protein
MKRPTEAELIELTMTEAEVLHMLETKHGLYRKSLKRLQYFTKQSRLKNRRAIARTEPKKTGSAKS